MPDKNGCITPLTGSNYATWKVHCKMALVKEGLWKVVDGSETDPGETDATAQAKFIEKKQRALAIIVLAVHETQLYLLPDPVCPVAVWKKLADQFQKKSWANKLALRRKLHSLKLKDKGSVQQHIKSLMEVFEELSIIGDVVDEEDRVVHLLASLPNSYDMLVTALEANSEVPHLATVTERLLHEERKLLEKSAVEVKNESDARALAAATGYQQGAGSGFICFYCKKSGHMKRNCTKWKESQKKREKENANVVSGSGRNQNQDSSDSECGFVTVADHALSSTSKIEKDDWLVDSGASKHMCNDEDSFTDMEDLDENDAKKVTVGNGQPVDVLKKGTVKLEVEGPNGEIKICKLKNVLFVPDLCFNLMSVGKASEANITVTFSDDECKFISEKSGIIATGRKLNGLYHLNRAKKTDEKAMHVTSSLIEKESIWHSRYAHLGHKNLSKLSDENMVTGLDYNSSKDHEFCKPCAEGKHHRTKFPKGGGSRANEVLELVHTDVCGKMDVESLSGKEYFGTFIDDKSRYTWAYGLKYKSDMFETFMEWKAMVERSTERKVKTLRSDNGGEYISNEFKNYLKAEGITHQNTVRKTPEQNGVAERMNRTLQEAMRSMLFESNLPKRFWAEALSTSTYLRNRSPTRAVLEMTPYEAFTNQKPDVDHLKVFGCRAYAHVPKDERKKLDSKVRESIFLGYGTNVKGYRLYDVNRQKVFFSRDVLFEETKFHYKKSLMEHTSSDNQLISEEHQVKRNEKERVIEKPSEFLRNYSRKSNDQILPVEKQVEASNDEEREDNTEVLNPTPDEEVNSEESQPQQNNLRKSTRIRRPPNHYGEWTNCVKGEVIQKDPVTVKEALNSDRSEEWLKAMKSEIKSLEKNQVWDLEKLPEGRSTVGCKWVFKTKLDAQGNVERYKARLVAQGFTQKYGVDYDETFSPVVRFESIRSLLAIASQHGLVVHQMDVKTAFLNGELKEEIFMRQPEGFISQGEEMLVCKLKRSLYGLKQSAKCWNDELDRQLARMDFTQSDSDPCIYIRYSDNRIFIIAVYVDDIILASESDEMMGRTKKLLSDRFDVEDMGRLHYFLGVKVVQEINSSSIWIGQPSFTNILLKRFGMEESNSAETPFDVATKLMKKGSIETASDDVDKQLYQSAVGSLLYLSTRTRPDISFAVGMCARFSAEPITQHWTAVKRILRYLKGTANLGLRYEQTDNELLGYSDADWAGDLNDRKSTSGYTFILSGAAISWKSRKQSCVALSTAEAEYMALASAAQEAIWMSRLICELMYGNRCDMAPVKIYEDNQSAICIAKNQQQHGRTKHIDIKYHFTREQIAMKNIEVAYCRSKDMVADVFTKPLSGPTFKRMCSMLGMQYEQ